MDSKEAREVGLETLVQEDFFSQDWLRSWGKGDWGVVGWRWSGVLVGKNDEKRDTYAENWAEDDAMKITKKLIKSLKDRDYWEAEVLDTMQQEEIDVNALWDTHLWHWIVVIDYHN